MPGRHHDSDGLHFDADEATIKPASRSTLDEIGKLMQREPHLNLLVVGHTDRQGGFEYNIELSKRRAASITKSLVNDYGVGRGHLKPWGVGYTAPAASNATGGGRAKNHRVGLVNIKADTRLEQAQARASALAKRKYAQPNAKTVPVNKIMLKAIFSCMPLITVNRSTPKSCFISTTANATANMTAPASVYDAVIA